MALDFSDPSKLQTRDGREVRIYATDHGGPFPVAGAVKSEGLWETVTWTTGGKRYNGTITSNCDIIPKPLRVTGWVNVYRSGTMISCSPSKDRQEVASGASGGCIGQIYIDAEVQT